MSVSNQVTNLLCVIQLKIFEEKTVFAFEYNKVKVGTSELVLLLHHNPNSDPAHH